MTGSIYDFYPLLVVGGIVGIFATAFIIAYATMKDKRLMQW